MCLILFAYRVHPHVELAVAANRDEWFRRPTAPAAFWEDHPDVFAGRDLEQGGTWLGVSRRGRLAAITNFRDPGANRADAPSRGALVSAFLTGNVDAVGYLKALRGAAGRYNGFSLLVWDGARLGYFSSHDGEVRELSPGVYGLSNHLLDTPWPKVREGKRRLAETIAQPFETDDLLALLDSTDEASADELPRTGVSHEWERRLSPMRIVADGYGTRSSTALVIGRGGQVDMAERTFDAAGRPTHTVVERFSLDLPARSPVSS